MERRRVQNVDKEVENVDKGSPKWREGSPEWREGVSRMEIREDQNGDKGRPE